MAKLLSFAEANPASQFELDGGIWITLAALNQSLTYAGMLVGLPSPRVNEDCKEQALESAASRFGKSPIPYLIEPAPIPYTLPTQRMKLSRDGQLTPAGEVDLTGGIRLPLVTCIGRFRCPMTLKRPEGMGLFSYSTATLVWFQESFAMPIAADVVAAMRSLRWEMVSADVSD